MSCLAIGLRSLKHPLTLTSIVSLLFNDHVLKAVMPSPLTGKLSDFAGLFFFPFLLTVLLSLPLDRLRVPARRTAVLAFGLTLIWFTLVKTWPWANTLTATALSILLSLPVQIVRDPTDLIALVVLWPAWRLWIHLERAPSHKPPGKAAYVALGLASLATLATSCPPPSSVTRLTVVNQNLYARISDYETAQSNDGGRTWTGSATPPEQIAKQMLQPASLPLTVCAPESLQTCYRVTGSEQVEGSQDGGQTWQVVWQVPSGRRKFMEAYLNKPPVVCKNEFSPVPYDLALLPQNGKHTLVVAMGTEGILVRTPEGDWQRRSVMYADPTPYTAEGMDVSDTVLILNAESLILFIAAIVAGWGLSAWGWNNILSQEHLLRGHTAKWATAPARWSTIVLVVIILFIFVSSGLMIYLIPAAVLLVLLILLVTWLRVASVSPRPLMAILAGTLCLLTALAIVPLAWLPFCMWAYGTIAIYQVAAELCIIIVFIAVVAGAFGVAWASHRAVTPNKQT